MNHYREHGTGRTIGQVLYCLEVYCESNQRLGENAQVGNGKVTYYGELVADFDWDENNIPNFDFYEFGMYPEIYKRFQEQQFFKKPFLDMRYELYCINYLVQELRTELSFDEALAIRHIRDHFKGEWNDITVKPETVDKIKKAVVKHSQNVFDEAKAEIWWQHFALCAIYSI